MTRKTVKDGGSVTMSTDKLAAISDDLKRHKKSVAQVGVLGSHSARSPFPGEETGLTNADIGKDHEFGNPNNVIDGHPAPLPQRSFLRMPLFSKLPDAINKLGRDKWRKLILEDGLIMALSNLAVLGEDVVQQAFETRGFGTWVPLAGITIRRKREKGRAADPVAILIDSAQLRQGVTSRVIDNSP